LPVRPGWRRGPDSTVRGLSRVQDARWAGLGKRAMSSPIVRHEVAHCE
jgi:hypothetical protein